MMDEPTPTVADRMRAAGLSEERIAEHADAGRVRLDGQPVALDAPAPDGSRVTLSAP